MVSPASWHNYHNIYLVNVQERVLFSPGYAGDKPTTWCSQASVSRPSGFWKNQMTETALT